MKFKVGDRVRRNSWEANGALLPIGAEGVVEIIFENSQHIQVLGYRLDYRKFDLVKPQTTPITPKSRECPCGIYRLDCTYHC